MCRFWMACRQGQHRARSWNPWHLQIGICFPPWLQLLALAEFTYWNPGMIAILENKISPISSVSQLSASFYWHPQSLHSERISVMHNTLERLLISKQTIILHDNVSIKLWWLLLNRSRDKSHVLMQNKGKSGWKRGKLQFKRKRSIIKGGSTGKKNINMLWSCQ